MPNLSFTLDSVLTTKPVPMIYGDNHMHDISPIVGTDGVTFRIDADLRQGEFFSVDAVLTTKSSPMIYGDNHMHTIQAILASTPPPAETFALDAVLTTTPVYYRFDNNHMQFQFLTDT